VRQLDLNADVGEGDPVTDEALLQLVSSANIACGFHAGDTHSMRATVQAAIRNDVAVGAHPGFDDREGFGRRPQHLTASEIRELLIRQLGALDAIARVEGTRLRHVKPHGALYNQAETDSALAFAIVAAIRAFDPALRFVGRAGSAMEEAARTVRHPFLAEAFADRRYRADGTLVPRSEPDAVLTDPEDVAQQVRSFVTDGEVIARDGSRLAVLFQTLCVHGDTPGAVSLARRIRQEFEVLGVSISAPPIWRPSS
jgi:UPF0271 protein